MPKGIYPHNPKYPDRLCCVCGKQYKPTGSQQKYCEECKAAKHREYGRKALRKRYYSGVLHDNCPQCGTRKQKTSELCRKCRHLYWREHPEARPGWKSQWKGGRHKNPKGYIEVWMGNKTYVLEHRLIWEQTHHKKIPKGWHIHHLNGIRDDNRPENLVAVRARDHPQQTLLKLVQKRVRELEQLRLL